MFFPLACSPTPTTLIRLTLFCPPPLSHSSSSRPAGLGQQCRVSGNLSPGGRLDLTFHNKATCSGSRTRGTVRPNLPVSTDRVPSHAPVLLLSVWFGVFFFFNFSLAPLFCIRVWKFDARCARACVCERETEKRLKPLAQKQTKKS